MLHNFSFVVPGLLAGSACPGLWAALDQDLAQARDAGITAVVTLCQEALPRHSLAQAGLRYLHLPVEDFAPPSPEQLGQALDLVDEEGQRGGAVLVHCFAGQGRTGTVLAAYLVRLGRSAEQAMAELRRQRPGSIESASQELAIHRYEAALRETGPATAENL